MDAQERTPPVKEGDVLEMICLSQGRKNDGVFKKNGLIIFVPTAVPEHRYEIKITKVLPKCAFGSIVQEL